MSCDRAELLVRRSDEQLELAGLRRVLSEERILRSVSAGSLRPA